MKKMFLILVALSSVLFATTVNITGKLDISKAGSFKSITATVAGTNISSEINKNDGSYSLKGNEVGVISRSVGNSTPVLAWRDLGKTVKMVQGDASKYLLDAYTFDGKQVVTGVKFVNNVAVVGDGNQMVYTRLRATNINIASRSMIDSTPVLGRVVFIIIDSDGKADTLSEVPVTNWDTLLPTKYVVSRNVDVTIPAKYDRDTVKVGWWNTCLNPSNYYSVVLGRSYKSQYSSFIYSVFDSASYGTDAYLYSAVAIIKRGDSVVAFTKDLDTVTAKVGNFKFDSTRFVNKIVSRPWADSAMIPWYSFTVNKSLVNVGLNKVMTLDIVVTYSDSLLNWESRRFSTGSKISVDTLSKRMVVPFVYDAYSDSMYSESDEDGVVTEAIDSIRVSYTPDTSVTDTANGRHTSSGPRAVTVVAGVRTSISFEVDRKNDFGTIYPSEGGTKKHPVHQVELWVPGATSKNVAETAKAFFVRKKVVAQYK